MMGPRQVEQGALFYNFSLDAHMPADHLLRSIDRFVDLSGLRSHLKPFYSEIGRPSIDPELLIRMLVIGYCFAVDASLIKADVNKQRSVEGSEPVDWEAMAATSRSVQEYLDTLDDAAWGAASEVKPKFVS